MAVELKPYSRYKDSGVQWLGKVPEHWQVPRVKDLCRMRSGDGITAESIQPVGLYPVYGGNGQRGYTAEYTHDGTFVLIGRQGALCGNVHLARRRFWASEHAVVTTARSGYLPEWLGAMLSVMDLNQYSIAAAQPGLSVERILNLPLPVPPASEQAAIVRFLDHAERRIRRYIRTKQKLIALLEERKQAVIHEAVTGQIDVRTGQPYPAYKDSGVNWLGEVPRTWDIVALRHRYSQCLGKMLDSKFITGAHSIPYLRNVDIQWDRINVENLPVMDISADEYRRFTVQRGDLLVCEGGEVGRCALWSDELSRCGFQKALHRLRPRNTRQDLPRFMYYVLRGAAGRSAFNDGHMSTIAHLTGEKLRLHRLPFPPAAEQNSIVGFLDEGLAQLDRACMHTLHQAKCLDEYRTLLITEVVTGKLDVREAAARLPEVNALAAK